MPTITRTLDNDGTLLSRRVAEDVAKDVLHITGFPASIHIVHEDELMGGSKQLESFYEKAKEGDNIRTQYDNYLFLTHNEVFTEEGVAQTNFKRSMLPPLFTDKEHGIYLETHYAVARTTVEMRVRTASLTLLKSWQNNLRVIHGQRSLAWDHTVLLEYPLPKDFIMFFMEAYRLKEETYPDLDTLGAYFKKCFRKGITSRSNLSGSYKEIISVETQSNVTGIMENEFGYNELEKQPGIYEAAITYNFKYRLPIATTLTYPSSIRNATIPKTFRDAWLPKLIDRTGNDYYYFLKSLYEPERVNAFYIGDGGSRVRYWDDWFPTVQHKGTQTVTIAPIKVDVNNLKAIVNLNDLSPAYMPQGIIDYLKINYGAHGLYRESLVVVEIFAIGKEETKLAHFLDASLNLTAAVNMDPRKRHYLRISLFKDLGTFNDLLLDQILADVELATRLFILYDPDLVVTSDAKVAEVIMATEVDNIRPSKLPSILYAPNNKYIDRHSFVLWVKKLAWTGRKFVQFDPYAIRNTTQFNTITKRRD